MKKRLGSRAVGRSGQINEKAHHIRKAEASARALSTTNAAPSMNVSIEIERYGGRWVRAKEPDEKRDGDYRQHHDVGPSIAEAD
jgi:hypothetical protein